MYANTSGAPGAEALCRPPAAWPGVQQHCQSGSARPLSRPRDGRGYSSHKAPSPLPVHPVPACSCLLLTGFRDARPARSSASRPPPAAGATAVNECRHATCTCPSACKLSHVPDNTALYMGYASPTVTMHAHTPIQTVKSFESYICCRSKSERASNNTSYIHIPTGKMHG